MNTLDAIELIYEHGPSTDDSEEIQQWNFALELLMDCLDISYCEEQDRLIYRQD